MTPEAQLKKTALFEEHVRLKGRVVDFGGWALPVQYAGVIAEHEACRTAAGLFDVSHMGEFHVEGGDSTAYLDFLVTNHVAKLAHGQALYSVMCYESGGIVDDLVIYRRSLDRYLVVVNASNTEKDFQHFLMVKDLFQADFEKQNGRKPDLRVSNESAQYTQIAIQGPKAEKILSSVTSVFLGGIKTYWFTEATVCNGVPTVIARTGYTGEDGFELYVPWNEGVKVWNALLQAGEPEGLMPCGLGARDTLRLEMKYPLYGNELSAETNPLEAKLGWVVKLEKGDFVGRRALLEAKENGLKRQLIGFKVLGRGIARHGYPAVTAEGRVVGVVTSGSQSPSLKYPIGIAYVESALAKVGSQFHVEVRGQKLGCEVVQTPFYKRPY